MSKATYKDLDDFPFGKEIRITRKNYERLIILDSPDMKMFAGVIQDSHIKEALDFSIRHHYSDKCRILYPADMTTPEFTVLVSKGVATEPHET